jgi:hypothetical protein
MKDKTFYIIKRVFIHIIGCALCVLQAYISMYEYMDVTSTVLNRSYIENIIFCTLFFYVFSLFLFSLFLFVLFLLKAKKIITICKTILIPLIYVAGCYVVNYEIFNSRITSWSTFSEMETIKGTVSESYIAILITTFIFYFMNKFLLNSNAK